jgi:two-component system chemotaxis response regulator CheB
MKDPSFITVIGASAGGVDALGELLAQLPEDIDNAIFVVLHLSSRGIADFLSAKLQHLTPLPCKVAKDGARIERGHIYIAPADSHLVIKNGMMKVVNGPVENRWRPSINVLFRSAAVAYGERVIGIILTGLLDDGTSGMIAIKKCGGTTIVQDPNEAQYPDMPLSVLNNLEVDYCLPLQQFGFIIMDVIANKEINNIPIPYEVEAESKIAENTVSGIEDVGRLGKHSLYSCPDCGGGLWAIKEDKFQRYRCHVGHSYSEDDLLKRQTEQIESTLWVALRMMEERWNLLHKVAREESSKGLNKLASVHSERADELKNHINALK